MFKLFKLKWQKELEELKSLHRIQLAEKDAALQLQHKELSTLLRLESEQKTKQLELDHQRALDKVRKELEEEVLKAKEDLVKSHYDKLTVAMTKLHEEGNLTTKFTQDLALKMMESAPTHKSQVKVITSGKDE